MKLLTKDKHDALPYNYYYIPIILLTLAGIGNSLYLAISHFRNYTDLNYASFCAISKAINCDTVSQSPWSTIFNVPVALWGVLGYLAFLIFLVSTYKNNKKNQPFWSILFILAVFYSLLAIFFGYISAEKIHSYCIMCLLSYAISFALLLYSWIVRRRFGHGSLLVDIKRSFSLISRNRFLQYSLASLLLSTFCLKMFLPHYWQYQFPESDTSISTGITDKGHPWIGSENPTLTIEEFTDYQCFQCAKMHYHLRQLVAGNPEKIRLVHRNYPMDHEVNPLVVPEPFHIGSARLALLSIAAVDQNKFWQINDALFKVVRERKASIDVHNIAKEANANATALTKTMYSKTTIKKLEADIRAGLRHNIMGTPAYIVNGQTYLGTLPERILIQMQ